MNSNKKLKQKARAILKMFSDFGIKLKLKESVTGPNSSYFTFQMAKRVRMNSFKGYLKDLQYTLGTSKITIEAPMQDAELIRIEVANKERSIYKWKDVVSSKEFKKSQLVEVPLGYTYNNQLSFLDITQQPHILIGGTIGSGKSMLLHSWICSFLSKSMPSEVRLVLVDLKRIDLNVYNGIPNLLTEIIGDCRQAISALKWTVAEMETRYKIFAREEVRNISEYNKKQNAEKIPYIIFIIDELSDLMTYAKKEVEEMLIRIAQIGRAAGLHLILSTQMPTSNILTGMLKANIPSRIAFNTASISDSRAILDLPGAEKLLGSGDMLYLSPIDISPQRIQGLFISKSDIHNIVNEIIKKMPEVNYSEDVTTNYLTAEAKNDIYGNAPGEKDPLFDRAVEIVYQDGKGSASLIQRRLSIGYARAARILDELAQAGIVGPSEGSKPRDVIK